MDYKKSKAPVNTVTRNIMDLCDETGNIYESVAIISERANQIAVEIKQVLNKKLQELPLTTTRLRRCLRTVSRLRSHATTRSFRSLHLLPRKSLLKAMSTIVIPQRTTATTTLSKPRP